MDLNSLLTGVDFSEEKLEKFVRGEGELDFRTPFSIERDKMDLETREAKDGKERLFLRVQGVATTSDTDANGVSVIPSALRSLPQDFATRNTLLFNHNSDAPIGVIGPSRYVELSKENSHVDVEAFVSTEARSMQTGRRFVDMIEDGTLSKFSFAWATNDGEVVIRKRGEDKSEEEDDDVLFRYSFGLDHMPDIIVRSLTAVELSVVSVPADAAAEFAVRSLRRNLSSVVQRFAWDNDSGLLVPRQELERKAEASHTHVESDIVVEAAEVEEEVGTEVRDVENEASDSLWDELSDELRSTDDTSSPWDDVLSDIRNTGGN